MKSYREIAEKTGATIADVREAMNCAKKREVPYSRTFEDFDHPAGYDYPCIASYGREEIAYDVHWVVLDKYQLRYVEARGRTREEAVINALNNGFRA